MHRRPRCHPIDYRPAVDHWSIHRVSVLSSEDMRRYATLGELRAALAIRR
jgi:hypothetical protein